MARLPTPHTIFVRRLAVGATDAHGNPVRTWGDPEPWAVHAIAPGASDALSDPNRDASLILWTVYAPASDDVPTMGDLVRIDGTDYGLDAPPSDWTRGPWPHPTAGVGVELRYVEG